VHTMGIMFLLFTPVPYMDASSSWSFRSRWHRALVGGAGMITELFVAALATFVWAQTGPGVVNSVAYNIMFVASVSTILFNANPLLRFDGYYILSDLLDIPNLHQRATLQVTQAVETHAFGVKGLHSPARSAREAAWLSVFAVASHVYRFFLFATILLFLADHFLILGVILTLICSFTWVILPVVKYALYVLASPRLDRVRPRAMAVSAAVASTFVVIIGVIPWPHHFRGPGVIEAVEHTVVAPDTPGRLAEILVPNGARVVAGTPLLRLENPELALELAEARSQVEETRVRELRALQQQTADLAPLASRLVSLQQREADLEARTIALVVRASHDGVWVAPRLTDAPGAWLERGLGIGQVINDAAFRFSAVVSQTEASRLFEGLIRNGEVRIPGMAHVVLHVQGQTIIPADRDQLPAPALGWRSGGTVAVRTDDAAGTRAAEPFFEVRALLGPDGGAGVLHGRSGWLRYSLPPEPLFSQLYRAFRQLLQQRYGL
jgi:putative peptide zinc metalloprotease protein